jgi:hypothetical protein
MHQLFVSPTAVITWLIIIFFSQSTIAQSFARQAEIGVSPAKEWRQNKKCRILFRDGTEIELEEYEADRDAPLSDIFTDEAFLPVRQEPADDDKKDDDKDTDDDDDDPEARRTEERSTGQEMIDHRH